MNKIEPPKVVKKLAEIKIEKVLVEGDTRPTIMLINKDELPAHVVNELLSTALMIITEFERSRIKGN